MKNFDLKEKQFQSNDPIDSYFECISSCDIKDENCMLLCVEMLKEYDN